MATLDVDHNAGRLVVFTRGSSQHFMHSFYEYHDGELILVAETETEFIYDRQSGPHYWLITHRDFITGEVTI